MPFPLPPLGVNASLAPFAAIAIMMIGVTIFVFGKVMPSDGRPPLITQLALALAVIGGGSVLLLSLVFVFISTDQTSAWTFVLLAFNFMMMGPAGLWFIGLVIFRDRRVAVRDWTWPVAIAVMTTGSEVLMGFLFALGNESTPLPVLNTLALGVSSVWFFWSMAAIMAALVLWAPLARVERYALVGLTLSAVIGPWVTSYPIVGGAAMTALMGGLFAYLIWAIAHWSRVRIDDLGLLGGLGAAFLAMAMAGLFLVVSDGTPVSVLAFGSVMAVVMSVEIAYLLRRYYVGSSERPWVARSSPDGDESTASRDAALPARGEARAREAVGLGGRS
ncbi:MAG TPA: hypothetical protein VMF04_04440 [Thermoplasmata archaeon]|nr:hypothetical protein [Thermoplasmata archaeon]